VAGKDTNQHYLPQAYLNRWGTKGRKKTHHVCSFNGETGETKFISVASVCSQRGYLDFHDDEGNIQSVDESWTKDEAQYLNYLKRFCQNPTVDALQEQKGDLARMIAYFLTISAAVREGYEQIITDLSTTLHDGHLDVDPVKLRREFIAMVPKATPQLTLTLMQMKWILIQRGSSLRFWTSDFPFAIETPEPPTLPVGPNEKGVWIAPYEGLLKVQDVKMWFPLSPDLLLLTCDPFAHARRVSTYRANFEQTREFNRAQVRSGQRFVFSNELNFVDVAGMLKENPELLKPGRRRSLVSKVGWGPVVQVHIA
jgi:hypothetical protein